MKNRIDKQTIYEAVAVRTSFVLVIMLVLAVVLPGELLSLGRRTFPVAANKPATKTIWVVATAYSSDVGQTDDTPCIPANGYDLCEHYEKFGYGNTIAANFLPLETHVRLPEMFGDKVFVVRDRMNSRYGYGRIDVWMPTKAEAKTFGVKYLQLEQYGAGKWRLAANSN